MNFKSKASISILIASMLFGVMGCNKTTSSTPEDPNHKTDVTEKEDVYFVQNGISEYQIVVPQNSNSTNMKYAKEELIRFVEEATGVTLEVINDSGRTHNKTQKFISLGDTSLFRSAEIAPITQELKRDGCRIVTVDNNIYIIGDSDLGVLYGVYDFLKINFNFEAYSPNCYTLNKGIKEIKLKEYNVVDIPDIEFRMRKSIQYSITSDEDDVMFAYRMRSLDNYNKLILPIHKSTSITSQSDIFHNSFYYIPDSEYKATHPEYFSPTGEQLCFTGRGNANTVEEMAEICAKKVIQSLKFYTPEEYPEYNSVQFGVNDTNSFCTCTSCRKCREDHNNADSAALIIFLKKVGKKVNAWMDNPANERYKRDLTYKFLAYQKTLTPPFTNPNNIPSDLTVDPDVKVMPFCALSGFNYGVSFFDESNLGNRRNIELWGTAFPGGWAWSYGGFFHDYMAFYDLYGFYEDYHAYIKKYGFSFTFEQVHDAQRGAESGFHTMAQYIISKKSWNNSLSVAELCDNYMHAMYGEAYTQMNDILTHFKLWFAKTYKDNSWGSSSIQQQPTYNSRYTSIGFVKQSLALFDEAYKAIETYKSDPVLYQKYLDRVDQEWLFIGKTIISCYQTSFSAEEIYDIKIKFRDIVYRLGVAELVEFVSIQSFIDSLF